VIKLKTINKETIPSAIEMAKQYRMLSEPEVAQSICQDVLTIDPDNQEALITLLLALTDNISVIGKNSGFDQAKEVVQKLSSDYCKAYYSGIIYERKAKYHLKQEGLGSGAVAYGWFRDAMKAFGTALTSCDPDNQDAILRWNSCARFINSHPEVKPDDADQTEMLLDPFDTPH
jgi:hypothetical protein